MRLPAEAWTDVERREGSSPALCSRFAAARVRPASRDHQFAAPASEGRRVVEWPPGEAEPTKYWLSTLPEDMPLAGLVKLRWRIERDYQDLKSELGLAHFEGRGWRGFHHHASLCIATYGFFILERSAFPPQRAGGAKKTCPFRPFSILTRRRSVPNATSPTRSRQCGSNRPSPSQSRSIDARAVTPCRGGGTPPNARDTVEVGWPRLNRIASGAGRAVYSPPFTYILAATSRPSPALAPRPGGRGDRAPSHRPSPSPPSRESLGIGASRPTSRTRRCLVMGLRTVSKAHTF